MHANRIYREAANRFTKRALCARDIVLLACLATLLTYRPAGSTPPRSQALGMVTGAPTGTAFAFGEDIAAVAMRHGLHILVKSSEGSLDNLRRLASDENAALAIVQADVLGYLSWSSEPAARKIGAQLRMIFPLHDEEVHILARTSIEQLTDLNDKRVIIGLQGSGTRLTAQRLLRIFDVTPAEIITALPPPEAVHAVLTDEADAMFYVGGKPVKLFANIQDLSGDPRYAELIHEVHFVPLPHDKLNRIYRPATIGPQDYAWLTNTIPTVAVEAVLVSFNFAQQQKNDYFQMRCAQLATLGRAVREHLLDLQSHGHPKWRDVNLAQRVSIWQPDLCSQSVRRELMRTEAIQQDFDRFLKTPSSQP